MIKLLFMFFIPMHDNIDHCPIPSHGILLRDYKVMLQLSADQKGEMQSRSVTYTDLLFK